MADWRRRSIAGGPSPATPNGDIPCALHLDFFYRPIAFPCDGAGGTRELEAAIMPTPRLTIGITDEAFRLPAADGDSKMAVASPATPDEASPLQPRQRQPAATGGGGSRRRLSWGPDDSGGRVSCPSSSQLPPLPDHVAVSFVNDEAGEEEEDEAASPWSGEDLEEDDMMYVHNDDDEQAMSSGRSGEDDEAMSSGRDEDDDEAISSGRDEDDDEAMPSGRGEDDDEDEDDEEEEEEEPQVPDKCLDCESMEKLVMLLPCRHSCYCTLCYRNAQWRTGPVGVRCPVCGRKSERGHHQSGRLGPTK